MAWKRIIPLFVCLLVLGLAACKPQVDWDRDENYTYLTISMSEADATGAIEKALANHIVGPEADLREGEVFVSGQVKNQETGKLVSGSLTLELWAEGGVLLAKVTSLDFAGWNASQDKLAQINQDIADSVTRKAASKDGGTELANVTITDTEISFTFRTPRKK